MRNDEAKLNKYFELSNVFIFLSDGKNNLKKMYSKVCRYKITSYLCSVIINQ